MSETVQRCKPIGLVRPRAKLAPDLIRTVIDDHAKHQMRAPPPQPILCEFVFVADTLEKYMKIAADRGKRVPAQMTVLNNSLLFWHVHKRNTIVILLPVAKVDAIPDESPVFAVYNCEIEPDYESMRAYNSRFTGVLLASLPSYAVYGTDTPITSSSAKRPKTIADTPAAPLTDLQSVDRAAVARKLKSGGNRLYDTLRARQPVTLEMLAEDALDSKVVTIDRWRLATLANNSFTMIFNIRGYMHREFVKRCATRMVVNGNEYYYMQTDALSASKTQPLLPLSPVKPEEKEEEVVMVEDVVSPQQDDDDVDIFAEDDVPLRKTTVIKKEKEQQQQPTRMVPHLLDRLRKLKLDQKDIADFEEIDLSTKHLLRVLFAICDYCENADDESDDDEESKLQESKDLMIVQRYPRGYLAPRSVKYAGAPGLRSVASPMDYAALGLGILCVVVRHDKSMLRWLLYAESLRLAQRYETVEQQRWHLEGIERFVAHTKEPDPDRHAQLSTLVYELRKLIAKRVPERWQEKKVN
jgi:hypothetical protein